MSDGITLVDLETGVTRVAHWGTRAYGRAKRWAYFHGLDPMTMPSNAEIIRDPARCRVMYEQFVYDPPEAMPDLSAVVVDWTEDGPDDRWPDAVYCHRIAQGEAPPLPFDVEIPKR